MAEAVENVQGRRRTRLRSEVWNHFIRLTDENGNADRARCRRCGRELSAKHGTTSLQTHLNFCRGRDDDAALAARRPSPPPCAPSRPDESSHDGHVLQEGDHVPCLTERGLEDEVSEPRLEAEANREPRLDEKEAIGQLSRMIACHGYDPSVLEDDYFKSFVRFLNPEFRLPSCSVIEEICDGIFDEARTDLFARLSGTSGRVSLAVGRTETMEGKVLYTACHFIDDEWNLHRVVLDAYVDVPWVGFYGPLSGIPEVCLDSEFTYMTAIEHVINVISRRGILDRLFMIAREKADTIFPMPLKDYIEQKLPNTYARRRELFSSIYMDKELHFIAKHLGLRPDFELEMYLESGVHDLHLTRQKRQQLLSRLGLDNLWAFGEHWYACYCSLQALRSEPTLAGINPEPIELLCNIWDKIHRAIKKVSDFSCPTSNVCFLELIKVREVLQSELTRTAGDNANDCEILCLSFLGGKDVADVLKDVIDNLDKIFKASYLVWSIPLVLDPRYNLRYIDFTFKRVFLSEAAHYIAEVSRQIKKLYADYIEYDAGTNVSDSGLAAAIAAGSSADADPLEQAWEKHCRSLDGVTAEVASYQHAETELDRYLKDCLAPQIEGFDILKLWKENSRRYPTVARMARDALAMPTCSKLSSEQIGHVRSIIRGYSKEGYVHSVPKCE